MAASRKPKGQVEKSSAQRQQSATQRDLSEVKLSDSKTQRNQTKAGQTQKDRDATQVARDTTQVHRDATQVSRDETQVERDATQVEREHTRQDSEITQAARDATQVARDATQIARDATQVSRDKTHRVEVKGQEKRRKRQLGAYVLIVLAGLLGFWRSDQLRTAQRTETHRAIAAECDEILRNSQTILKIVNLQGTATPPPGSSKELIAAYAQSNADAAKFRASVVKILGPLPDCNSLPK